MDTHMNTPYTMTIGGKAITSTQSMDVINPSTGKVFAQAPAADQAILEQAISAAQNAFLSWKAVPYQERVDLILKAADALAAQAKELAALFTLEHGRPTAQAEQEILGASGWMQGLTQIEMPIEVVQELDDCRLEIHREPLGVICALVPWNFPILMAAWKTVHAVLTGNTVVLKPSPFTPLCTLKMGEIFRDIFPAGVVNVISGGDELGPLMTSHPGFAKISFTGSTATGKRIMQSAANNLSRITLELGGNDAAIVLADVDLDAVMEGLFMSAFFNAGQICVATKRLYVHDDIYDDVLQRFHGMAQAMKLGDGSEADTVFGPIQNRPQYLRVKDLIKRAKAEGLTLLEGAPAPENDGYFIPLTLVDNPPETSCVVVEEAFGPVLPLLRFTDIDEVIERANNTEYGLGGTVWSSDVNQAIEIAKRLDTGTVRINQSTISPPSMAFGGRKQSGIGVENGLEGLLEFTQRKNIVIPKS